MQLRGPIRQLQGSKKKAGDPQHQQVEISIYPASLAEKPLTLFADDRSKADYFSELIRNIPEFWYISEDEEDL